MLVTKQGIFTMDELCSKKQVHTEKTVTNA